MKINIKKTAAVLLSFFTAGFLFAQEATTSTVDEFNTAHGTSIDATAIREGLNAFSNSILVTAPHATTQQNIWADAYIGAEDQDTLFHIGGGVNVGGTLLDMSGFNSAAAAMKSTFGATLPSTISVKGIELGKIPDNFFLPVVSLDVRVDGMILPFDVGLSAMMTNPSLFSVDYKDIDSILSMNSPTNFKVFGYDGSVDYLTIGVDLRYCINENSTILPFISIGGGYSYTKGSFTISSEDDSNAANMNIGFTTQIIYLQAQASKELGKLTVFGGLKGLVAKTNSSWAWSADAEYEDGGAKKTATIAEYGSVDANDWDVVYRDGLWDFSCIQPQAFAGCGFKFLMFQTTLSASCDLRSFFDAENYSKALWSGALSFRAKM